jgi:NADPH:quinone reductase-like Zn-dependent oxidoreductase
MKAAVLHELGGIPRYEDFPDPVAGDGEVVVEVKAVAVEKVDKAVAAGTHFAARQFLSELPAIVCFDGIGALPDGTLVGFGQPRPPYGALAERTVVPAENTTPAPEGIDPTIAVVVSSAVTGFAVKTAAGFTPGETVLVQGATGVAGRLAVQVARLLGARRVVARSVGWRNQLHASQCFHAHYGVSSLRGRCGRRR